MGLLLLSEVTLYVKGLQKEEVHHRRQLPAFGAWGLHSGVLVQGYFSH
jgi:hypothetical protein